jgi:Xaa-Pro aminopeptidase
MLTATGCKTRRDRLWSRLDPKPDWILISDPQHQMYFANYFQSPFIFRSTNAAAVLILGADGTSILVADNMLRMFTDQAQVDEVVAPTWYRGVESAPHREAQLIRETLERLKTCDGSRFGVELSQVPAGILEGLREARPKVEVVSVDAVIHGLKRAKDADELEMIRRSMRAGEAGHAAGLEGIHPGMTELEAFLLVQQAAIRDAEDTAIVYGDFVSGPRCEQVGGPPTARIINRGDLVLLDFSVVIGGYRGDFANTFVCGAKPTAEQARLHEACLEAMLAGERLIAAGRPAREIDEAVRASFDSKHLRETFSTHSGHGLGLGHPDPPYLVPESTDVLVAGDVIAIEPGQYVKGVGGMRFERNYLVTETGYEVLSNHTLAIEQPAST